MNINELSLQQGLVNITVLNLTFMFYVFITITGSIPLLVNYYTLIDPNIKSIRVLLY